MTRLKFIPWNIVYEQVRENIPRVLQPSSILSNLRAQHAALTAQAPHTHSNATCSTILQTHTTQPPIPVTIHLTLQVSDTRTPLVPIIQVIQSTNQDTQMMDNTSAPITQILDMCTVAAVNEQSTRV